MRTPRWIALISCLACASGAPQQAAETPPVQAAPPAPPVEARPVAFAVPAVFSSHMVLQRDRPNAVWGWDRAGTTVTVTLDAASQSASVDANGRWQVMLPPQPPGGPHTLTIAGTETRRFDDVLFGEVWLASGQSNMEFDLGRASDAPAALAGANRPSFRMFTVKRATAAAPATDVVGTWQVSTPETAPRFSAVAYYFGVKIQEALNVPVGIIHSSWGGTPAEAWTSRTALAARPETKALADSFASGQNAEAEQRYERAKAEWRAKVYCKDPGIQGMAQRYAELEFDDSKWQELEVPGLWQDNGLAINGAVWFRRSFVTKKEDLANDFELELGPIDDFDQTFVNGQKVGGLGSENPDAWNTPRKYKVPKSALRVGKNVVAVRVFDHFGGGGFHGSPNALRVFPVGRLEMAQSLAGKWRYFVEWSVPHPGKLLEQEPKAPAGANNQNSPGVLFDAMIAPLVPYGLRGAIWYQGESNVGRAAEYRALLPTLIGDWRARFQSELPFYIVQLTNFLPRKNAPEESAWAELRDAQAAVAASVPRAGLAVTIDIGEASDIHPKNKRDVGERLALVALAKTYEKPGEYSGPVVESVRSEKGKLRVTFTHADGLSLTGKGKKPVGFAIAGADRKFFWATGKLDKNAVVLSSKDVKEPRFVRYAWADNPEANLVNSAKLPAGPFEAEAK